MSLLGRTETIKIRPCRGCWQTFDTTRSHARFCSNACRQKAYRDRNPSRVLVCGAWVNRREVVALQKRNAPPGRS